MQIDLVTFVKIFLLSLPIFVAMVGCVIVGLAWSNSIDSLGRRMHKRLLLFLLLLIGTWIGRFVYFSHPSFFAEFPSLHGIPTLCLPITMYAYIRLMVNGWAEKSAWRHYILPLILALLLAPFRQPEFVQSVTGMDGVLGMHRLHLAFSAVYCGLILALLLREYKEKRFYRGVYLMPVAWRWLLISIILVRFFNSIIFLRKGNNLLHEGLSFFVMSALPISLLLMLFLYHVVCRDFYFFYQSAEIGRKNRVQRMANGKENSMAYMESDSTDLAQSGNYIKLGIFDRLKTSGQANDKHRIQMNIRRKNSRKEAVGGLTCQKFERFFFKHKCYLDPDLSLTELARQLQTNRTYLSAFINREYGMNFSQYVNSCRLKELDYLKSLSRNKKKNIRQLVATVGFGTYEGYLKARKKVEGESGNE
ncbi:helix-turn-helix domain-containing protein [Bacteroides reticulotermitis]|nr:AraC family transcriptional regulator [Bacteroides reticulotermitis]MBB4045298.1 AraC-like DNA-binding protein/ABC-type sugar transport system permease subunit [Bacteroides reticulotermitis]